MKHTFKYSNSGFCWLLHTHTHTHMSERKWKLFRLKHQQQTHCRCCKLTYFPLQRVTWPTTEKWFSWIPNTKCQSSFLTTVQTGFHLPKCVPWCSQRQVVLVSPVSRAKETETQLFKTLTVLHLTLQGFISVTYDAEIMQLHKYDTTHHCFWRGRDGTGFQVWSNRRKQPIIPQTIKTTRIQVQCLLMRKSLSEHFNS